MLYSRRYTGSLPLKREGVISLRQVVQRLFQMSSFTSGLKRAKGRWHNSYLRSSVMGMSVGTDIFTQLVVLKVMEIHPCVVTCIKKRGGRGI